jgi:hypothetical protein
MRYKGFALLALIVGLFMAIRSISAQNDNPCMGLLQFCKKIAPDVIYSFSLDGSKTEPVHPEQDGDALEYVEFDCGQTQDISKTLDKAIGSQQDAVLAEAILNRIAEELDDDIFARLLEMAGFSQIEQVPLDSFRTWVDKLKNSACFVEPPFVLETIPLSVLVAFHGENYVCRLVNIVPMVDSEGMAYRYECEWLPPIWQVKVNTHG